MTTQQFRDTLLALGVSQQELAKLAGFNPRTVRRWALGELPVPTAVALVLRYWQETGRRPDELD